MTELTEDQRRYFRNAFKQAREKAFQDAESFDEIIFVVERLGSILCDETRTLGGYRDKIVEFAKDSPLCCTGGDLHTPFPILYKIVTNARNDAMHQGAFARHLTAHCIELALVLEDAMRMHKTVSDFMVMNPICAEMWLPISIIRQQMLANSFSYLPVFCDDGWQLVSDLAIVRYLTCPERNSRMIKTLSEALQIGQESIVLTKVTCCVSSTLMDGLLASFQDSQCLVVCRENCPKDIVGILTPFDLL